MASPDIINQLEDLEKELRTVGADTTSERLLGLLRQQFAQEGTLDYVEKRQGLEIIMRIEAILRGSPLSASPPPAVAPSTPSAPSSKEALTPADQQKQARKRIEQAWADLRRAEKVTKDYPPAAEYINKSYTGQGTRASIESAGILPLVREFFPTEIKAWELKIQLSDGFNAGANKDVFKQFYFVDARESRLKEASHIGFPELKAFFELPEIKPMVIKLEDYFDGDYSYVNTSGVRVTHNYGRDGNPNESQAKLGVMTIGELLRKDFPAVAQSTIDAVQYAGIIGEIRLKYYTPYYAQYLKTADGTFDTGIIGAHSPMAALLYKIRGYGRVPSKYKLLWQILRLPKTGSLYRKPVKGKIGLDAKHNKTINENTPDDAPVTAGVPNKRDNKTAINNHNLEEAIDYREIIDSNLTRDHAKLIPVQVGEDLVSVPFIWNIVRDGADGRAPRFGAITLEEFNKALEAWEKFIDFASHPNPIKKLDDFDDNISQLVGKMAPFKSLLACMPETTLEGKNFRDTLQQILLRFTKTLYDICEASNYPITQRMGRPLTKRKFILDIAIKEYTKLGTLDYGISNWIITTLRSYNIPLQLFDDLFSPSKPSALTFASCLGNIRELRRREHIFHSYGQSEPEDQKNK